ncbi:DUF2235 domain-containing protein [Tabrizicola sp. J26]|uniref:DUF2235 domain-containing protein n=1 Tax=Alitabrizicola rongguiensis TaxID=2909234 RepID=UPI001F33F257|nr:DUF2235 domain-containing protein [Tabrizicola rongguiensis]MCF1710943.1 DUF2235 domain-containing protein [Tabrizicola rongguiensis]
MRLIDRLSRWLRRPPVALTTPDPLRARGPGRQPVDHVVILDGTMSSLQPGHESNAGLTFRLLREGGKKSCLSIYYEPGIQWTSWAQTRDVIQGKGLNRQIRRAYGFLASRYRPGDRIFLFGYSRGAYAVRSLAGVIDRVGLLRPEAATERAVTLAYRHYQTDPDSPAARAYAAAHCHPGVEIQMIGVWDTVKALGLRLPLLWMLTEKDHAFHTTHLGRHIRHGFHALALDETREAYAPVLWTSPPGWQGNAEQMWFPGSHGDVGGQLEGRQDSRPLSNISLVWMLERAEVCGLPLPHRWRARFPCDPEAPMIGTWSGWGVLFLMRRRRRAGQDRSEHLHPSVGQRGIGRYQPRIT